MRSKVLARTRDNRRGEFMTINARGEFTSIYICVRNTRAVLGEEVRTATAAPPRDGGTKLLQESGCTVASSHHITVCISAIFGLVETQ